MRSLLDHLVTPPQSRRLGPAGPQASSRPVTPVRPGYPGVVTGSIPACARRLADGGVESAPAEARTLVAHVAGVPLNRVDLVTDLVPAAAARLDDLIARRLTGVPLQHLTGLAHFRTVTLEVGPGVFIPRPETEVMTGWALDWLRSRLNLRGDDSPQAPRLATLAAFSSGVRGSATPGAADVSFVAESSASAGAQPAPVASPEQRIEAPTGGRRIVELCAGSGAISLALAAELVQALAQRESTDAAVLSRRAPNNPPAGVLSSPIDPLPWAQWAVEISPPALEYLRRNTAGWPIRVVAGDMADALPELDGTVDLVVANPPYVPAADWPSLPREVKDHDPAVALVAGPDGLDAIRVVARVARRLLRPGGVVTCEHDETHGESAPAVFRQAGFVDVADHADLTGRPRFVTATAPPTRGQSVAHRPTPATREPSTGTPRAATATIPTPVTRRPSPGHHESRIGIDEVGVGEAVLAVLRRDECVVVPTDTVYGIAALASSRRGVDRLQAAKGRGDDFPPPLLIADPTAVEAIAASFPAPARRLVAAHWPGALTVIVPLNPDAGVALGPVDSVALRVPDHEGLRRLLRQTGPLAVSSANRHGQPPATTVDQAVAELGRSVGLYVDGGPTPGSTPSTIVTFVGPPRVLRLGRLDRREIERTLAGA